MCSVTDFSQTPGRTILLKALKSVFKQVQLHYTSLTPPFKFKPTMFFPFKMFVETFTRVAQQPPRLVRSTCIFTYARNTLEVGSWYQTQMDMNVIMSLVNHKRDIFLHQGGFRRPLDNSNESRVLEPGHTSHRRMCKKLHPPMNFLFGYSFFFFLRLSVIWESF